MIFQSKEDVLMFIKKLTPLKAGSQSDTYLDVKRGVVYKFFKDWQDEEELEDLRHDSNYSKETILQFKDLKNKTVPFPFEVIVLQDAVIGYVTRYRKATNFYKIDPLTINLDRLARLIPDVANDISYLSKNGVGMFDVMYNTMLGSRIYIVDTLDYTRRDYDYKYIFERNMASFNLEIMKFLVYGYFEETISGNKSLMDMYTSSGYDMQIVQFIQQFKNYLSKEMGKDIRRLSSAKSLMNTHEREDNETLEYKRALILK